MIDNSNDLGTRIAGNYRRVLEKIDQAALSAGRQAKFVRLVVVTKGQPLESVKAVISAGARWLGENYVEEAIPKLAAIEQIENLEWHMIGHVQSRKAKPVSENFAWVQSVDSLKLASRLDRFAGETGRCLSILLECNVSGEEGKFGWKAAEEFQWSEFAREFEQISRLEHLKVCGLMTIPPLSSDPEFGRPVFIKLRHLKQFLASRFPEANLSELSMGMSGDYRVAIQEGATIVRIGTAIMGARV